MAHTTKQLAFSAQNLHGAFRYLKFHFIFLLSWALLFSCFYSIYRREFPFCHHRQLPFVLSSGGLTCTTFLFLLPAHLHPPCALFPEEYCTTTLVLSRQKQWGHYSYCPRSPIVSPAVPQFIPLWIEPVFLTAGNKGRCQNPLLVFSQLERCYSLVCSVSLKARPMCQQFNSLLQITLQHN